ncbi:hypothetical protein EMCG_01762 [[Emmonsia] crescens]|uniref:Uncharacterized protein n=1 Tax=[Emmonsia] crescens TaxID=73230 RepID=A0A0G2J297_9EURO|nr:hypothetical protein EMCG_01762 [Emmonsia crescens UAMH 3008]
MAHEDARYISSFEFDRGTSGAASYSFPGVSACRTQTAFHKDASLATSMSMTGCPKGVLRSMVVSPFAVSGWRRKTSTRPKDSPQVPAPSVLQDDVFASKNDEPLPVQSDQALVEDPMDALMPTRTNSLVRRLIICFKLHISKGGNLMLLWLK